MASQESFDDEKLSGVLRALFEEGRDLGESSRRQIIDLGEAATTRLLEIVTDEDLWDEAAPGEGFAPIYAAEILGDIGDEAAIEPLFRKLPDVDPDALLDDAIVDALRCFGAETLEVGLQLLDSWDDPFLEDLAYVVAGLPMRHERILQILLKYFMRQPVPGAELLAMYGDPTATDALDVALDRYIAAGGGDPTYRRPVFAIADAIEELGGELSEEQRREVDLLKEVRTASQTVVDKLEAKKRRAPDDDATYRKSRDIGRNEPCWCGSGQKYKHCHWADDHR